MSRAFATRPIATPKAWALLEHHELADLFEFGESVDFEGMVKSMQENGFDDREPIILYEGKVISGRTRHRAAAKAEVIDPPFHEFCGTNLQALIQKDLLRRHATPSQLALAAVRLKKWIEEGRFQTAEIGEPTKGKVKEKESDDDKTPSLLGGMKPTQENVAKATGASLRSVQRSTVIEEKGVSALRRLLRIGAITDADGEKVARLPKLEQEKAIKKFNDAKAKGKSITLTKAAGIKEEKPPKPAKTPKAKKDDTGTELFSFRHMEQALGEVIRLLDLMATRYSKNGIDEKKSPKWRFANQKITEFGEAYKSLKETYMNAKT